MKMKKWITMALTLAICLLLCNFLIPQASAGKKHPFSKENGCFRN